MFNYLKEIGLLTAVVYGIVESLEKFGVKKKYAHLLAIPIGIIVSIIGFPIDAMVNKILYGVIIGILSVGSCDTACNVVSVFKKETTPSEKK